MFEITYDANGNTLSDPSGKSYSWDFENRLVSAVVPGTGTVTFKYDPFGRRIQKSGPLGTTNYLYDGLRLIEELDNAGNVLARYTQGKRVDEPLAELRQGTTSYYEQDGIASITSLSNSSGALANTYNYDSFGKLTASTGTITNPFQYTGRESDQETGIYFYRARYFDQNVGRFVSEDPIQLRGGVNFYAYARNKPVGLIDPLGYQGCDPAVVYPAQSPCLPTAPDAPYQGPDGLWYNVPEWHRPDPTLTLPSPSPTPPPHPNTCDHQSQNPNHNCAAAYWETGISGAGIVGWLAVDLYLIGPALEDEGFEGLMIAFGHGAATTPIGVAAVGYVDGIENITRNCPLIIDWFYGN